MSEETLTPEAPLGERVPGTGLVQRQPLSQPARRVFDEDQLAAIRGTVAKDCNNAEFVMFMELVARYELDPFARQIFAAKMGGRDGAKGGVAIIVGRDGFLTIANRNPEFRGMRSLPVYEKDTFKRTADGRIVHEFDGVPGTEQRGKLMGAWAEVYRDGREPVFFYAPLDEYEPKSASSFSPWSKQRSAMIKKCAEANALRIAFQITGLYDEAEMDRAIEVTAEVIEEPDWGTDPEVAERLKKGFAAVNDLRPGTYPAAQVRLMLANLDQYDKAALAQDLSDQVDAITAEMEQPPEDEAA